MPGCKERRSSKDDLLRPRPQEASRILLHSQNTWSSLLSAARTTTCFPDSCSNIRTLLHKTPAIPDSSSVTETVERDRLSIEGYSQWKINSISSCDLTSKVKRSSSRTIVIGELQPTFCKLSEAFLPKGTGLDIISDALPKGNYLCVFVLGWSYVLSARLLELRKENDGDKLSYTESKAISSSIHPHTPDHEFLIPVGDADEEELRWWAAILAKGCGWRATLTRDDSVYSSPWACHLNDDRSLTILHNEPGSTPAGSFEPPSSARARDYLLRLAHMHDAVDQLIIAFVATLTIPRRQRFGAPVQLPEPRLGTWPSRDPNSSYMSRIPSFDELPYFMSLSCISGAISSSLFGSFWQPGVSCNLVSEWLHTPLQVMLQQLIDQKEWHVIVQIMAARRPNLASLWLGTAITGLLPRLLKVCARFIPPVSLEATVWTMSPQSFMDPNFHRKPSIQRNIRLEKVIPREDEFRLLYITDFNSENYATVPLFPYPPFGVAKLHETALEVRLHVSCGHRLAYSHWVWQDHQGSKGLDDYGFALSPSVPPIQQSRDRRLASLQWNTKSNRNS